MHATCWRAEVDRVIGIGGPAPRRFVAIALLVAAAATGRLRAADDKAGPLPPRALVRIGTDDLRTSGRITAIAFSPDGRLIAAADPGATSARIVIFDVHSGRPVRRLTRAAATSGRALRLAFSPDGTMLLWGEDGGEVALCDLKGDQLLFREKVHQNEVSDVAFSPDGSLLASADQDAIHLRRVASPGEIVRTLPPRPRPALPRPAPPKGVDVIVTGPDIVRLAFTPDGARLLAGPWSSATISVWRLGDGQLERQIGPVATMGMNTVSVTSDGRRVLTAGGRQVPTAVMRIRTRDRSVTLAEVRLWDIGTGGRLRTFDEAEGAGFGYAGISPDGRRIAVALFNELRILDAATGRSERTIELPGSWGYPPAFSADGALVAMPDDNSVAIFEVATGRRLHHDAGRPVGYPAAAAWSPSGDRIVTGHADGVVRVRDAATGRLIWHQSLGPVVSPGGPKAVVAFVGFSRDAQHVVATGRRDDPERQQMGIVTIYDAGSGRIRHEIPQEAHVSDGLLLDGRIAVFASAGGRQRGTHFLGIELATGRTRWVRSSIDLGARFGPVTTLQSETKGPWFRAALRDGIVVRYNALTGHEQRRFLADWQAQTRGAFGAGGRILVTSQMEWIHVWDVESGALRRKFRHPLEHVCNLTLAPDGRTLATWDIPSTGEPIEKTIRLYDIETGEPILALEPDDDRAGVLAFSPDGNRLFSGFSRSSAMVWDVRRGRQGTGPK